MIKKLELWEKGLPVGGFSRHGFNYIYILNLNTDEVYKLNIDYTILGIVLAEKEGIEEEYYFDKNENEWVTNTVKDQIEDYMEGSFISDGEEYYLKQSGNGRTIEEADRIVIYQELVERIIKIEDLIKEKDIKDFSDKERKLLRKVVVEFQKLSHQKLHLMKGCLYKLGY